MKSSLRSSLRPGSDSGSRSVQDGAGDLHDAGDIHIAGVLVHGRFADPARLRTDIDAMPGAEVFRTGPDGKVVVVLEAPSQRAMLETMDRLRALPGVLDVALVYQHAEPASALDEEIDS